MRFAFPAPAPTDSKGTADQLSFHQLRLHDEKATAILEIALDEKRTLLLLYAHGIQAGAYVNDGEICVPVSAAEELARRGDVGPLRAIPLPDKVARAAWLTCEATKKSTHQGPDEDSWSKQLQAWRRERVNGMVEAASDRAQAYVLLRGGEMLESESAFLSAGRLADISGMEMGSAWSAVLWEGVSDKPSSQCLMLRQAVHRWSRNIFESYRNIAGEKFLQVMTRELQTQIRPWQWNIRVEAGGIRDEHFFPGLDATAHACRALFMGIGAQMGFAIGGYLAQRILQEMFDELSEPERARLEAHRLIPAAFSE